MVSQKTQQQGWEKSAEPAHCSDQAGNRSDVPGKVLRHELEDRAVTISKQEGASKCAHSKRQHRRPRQQEGQGNDPKENGLENASASDFIRYPTAQRASQGCQHNKTGSTKPGVRRLEPELVFEQDRQVDRKMQQIHRMSGSKKGKAPTITVREREVEAL